jgi:zinc transport system substrate-binding protein
MAKHFRALIGALVLLTMPLAGQGYPSEASLTVFVSILPQKQIVQRIGQDRVDVQVMVPAGANPHAYEPRPGQMAALTRARIYFSIGVAFEDIWLARFSDINRNMTVVATDRGIKKLPMTAGHHHAEDHGHKHGRKQDPYAFDPHIWLSPPLIKKMAHTIRDALSAADPAQTALYDRHYATYLHELDELDRQIRQALISVQGKQFMVFHPSWGYFAQEYGLIQVPVEIEGKEPKPAQLQKLIQDAKASNIEVVFVQPQFSPRSAKMIADAIGGRIFTADPLAPDLAKHLLELTSAIKSAVPEDRP